MSKRKFDDFRDDKKPTNASTSKLSKQHTRVQAILDNGTSSLYKALKVARGFERQKMGRRQKTAGKENKEADLKRIQDEVIALKSLDLEKVGKLHLYKTILKNKFFATSDQLPSSLRESVEAAKQPQTSVNANVQARLFNSAPVKTAMLDVMESVRRVLSILEKSGGQINGNAAKAAHGKISREAGAIQQAEVAADLEKSVPKVELEEASLWVSEAEESEEDDLRAYESRLADSEDDSTRSLDFQRYSGSEWSGFDDGPKDGDLTSEIAEEKARERTTRKRKSTAAPPNSRPSSTTFLPTLSMGGYWSGSESGSEIDDNAGKIEIRKNKKGQRERRAIWEKKFGQNANHIKKQVPSRDQGWDARKGATAKDGKDKSKGRYGRERELRARGKGMRDGTSNPMRSGANDEPVKSRVKPSGDGKIHPSWEAARKVKEQKQTQPFQGKKITFD